MAEDPSAPSPETIAVTAGRPQGPGAPMSQSPVFSAMYARGGDRNYARESNPTWEAFEEVLGALEGGSALAFSSGMAAVAAVIGALPAGSSVLAPHDAFQGSRVYLRQLAEDGYIKVHFVDVSDTDATLSGVDGADLVWLESPTNPRTCIADIVAISAHAKERGVSTVVDNTFATPVLQRPLDLGADIVVHSASKYLSGHSDVVMGATVTRSSSIHERLVRNRTYGGAIPGPMEAFLALRGLRTLPLRMERAQANALDLAGRLEAHGAVERVLYPGLASHPNYERARAQMKGPGAIVSFLVVGGAEAAEAVCERVRSIRHVTSLGGIESTIERRARYEDEGDIPENLLRFSVGIENVEDIWRDLDRALGS